MKKMRVSVIYSTFAYLWSLHCLAVQDTSDRIFDALFYSELDEVKQVLVASTDVNLWPGVINVTSRTPLEVAIKLTSYALPKIGQIRYKVLKVLMLLIEKGAHINGRDDWGWTPLMRAVAQAKKDPLVVELLLSYNADLEAEIVSRETAFDVARKDNLREVLELLIHYPVLLQKVKLQPNRALLRECIEKGRFTLVKLLLQRGVTVILDDYRLAQKKYNQTQSMAYEIIGKLLKEQLSTTTKLGLIAHHGIVGANTVSHSGDYLELTQNIAEHIGSFLPF